MTTIDCAAEMGPELARLWCEINEEFDGKMIVLPNGKNPAERDTARIALAMAFIAIHRYAK